MELQQLRYLIEVAKCRSFTRAADECHVTQPTLSHQIKKLEEEVGEPLFQRRKKGAFLTPLGERIFQHANSILETVETVRQEASAFSAETQGQLRVGIIPTVAPYFLPRLLSTCRKKHPGITFQVTEDPTDSLLAAMRRGALDVLVLSPPIVGDDLKFKDLFEDEFLLAAPPNHALARAKNIGMGDLRSYPMILMNDAHCLRGQTLSLCKRAGFTPQVFIQSAQLDTVLALVELGLGISLIPASARRSFRHRKVVFRSLKPEKLSRRVSLVWPRQGASTRALIALIELAEDLA
jgi:LysR family transcriptional regulator, hydrogen peroxide-inducible genes activator